MFRALRLLHLTVFRSLERLCGMVGSMIKTFSDYQLFVLEKGEIRCSDVRRNFGDYFDGELPPTLSGRIAAHIEGCPCCQEFQA